MIESARLNSDDPGTVPGSLPLPPPPACSRRTPAVQGPRPGLLQCTGSLSQALASQEPSVMPNFPQVPGPGARTPHGTQVLPTRRIRVIGVPLDMGASRRGVDMGPSAVRVAGLEARLEALGHRVVDGGNIRVEIAETQAAGSDNARYLKQIAETCNRTAEAVVKTLEEGVTPLVLGGD